MSLAWDGRTRVEDFRPNELRARSELADAAEAYDWKRVGELVEADMRLVNSWRPGGTSWYAPLHQVAHGGGPIEAAARLVEAGAWRSLRNRRGERAEEIALRRGNAHLAEILRPTYRCAIAAGPLQRLQSLFHDVIRGRASRLVDEHRLRLPELEPLLEQERQRSWFAVPGMTGGFSYQLDQSDGEVTLISESWCRVVEGSGQRHEITIDGSRLTAEGFV